jgi:replicative DNA helicase
MTELLTDADIAARLAAFKHGNVEAYHVEAVQEAEAKRYRFVRPLVQAADSLIEYLQNVDGRFMFGLEQLDQMTRGIGAGELAYVTGYTHSGKTQVFLTAVVNNKDRPIVLVTMDETSEQVLTKLVCMLTGSNAERLEERVRDNDQAAIDRVRRIAREDLANLVVVDGGMHLRDISTVISEAEDHWGQPVAALGIDYLDLLKTDDSDVEGKSQSLKAWVVAQSFPTICVHQGSRGNSGGGQKLAMNSMKYAGEAEATFVIGVRRLRDDPDNADNPFVKDTVEVALIKNKRPPSKVGEFTFYMKPESGLVLPIERMP